VIMATLSPVIRGGPLLGLLAVLFAGTPATASDAPRHHYSINGSLSPVATTAASGGSLQVKSQLSSERTLIPAQSGNGMVLSGKLAASPLGCAGDTIFANGFDP